MGEPRSRMPIMRQIWSMACPYEESGCTWHDTDGDKKRLFARFIEHEKFLHDDERRAVAAASNPEVEHDDECWIACPHPTPPAASGDDENTRLAANGDAEVGG